MKIAELDWERMLSQLRHWDALSTGARRAFLRLQPGRSMNPAEASPAVVDELVAAGFLAPPPPRGSLYAVSPEARRLHTLVRAMDRIRVLDAPGELPGAYVQEHFTGEHTRRLSAGPVPSYGWGSRADVAAPVSSVDWVSGVLALGDPGAARQWEQPRLVPGEEPSLALPGTLDALQRLITALAEHPAGVPLRVLGELLPGTDAEVRAAAVRAGIRYLLLFPALRGADMEACIGLLPSVARRMGSRPAPPRPVQALEAYEAPFRLGDMMTMLVEAATEPIPVRGHDGSLYVRAQKALAARLPAMPAWVAQSVVDDDGDEEDEADGTPPGAAERIRMALRWLQALKLAVVHKRLERYELEATGAGRRWLAAAEGDRLREILSALRASTQRNPDGGYGGTSGLTFFPSYLGLSLSSRDLDLRNALTSALLSVPEGEMVEADGFLRYHAQERNPFLAPGLEKLRTRIAYARPLTREMWESVWSRVLWEFLMERMVPLGGVRLGRLEGEHVAFGVTPAGRYLLGAAEDFAYAPAAEGEVIVQPDFEVVFLAPAPRVEAELGRFAERTGAGVGALFRITRASVLRAAEQGLAADAVLATLEQVSRSGVPPNVARQVRDWIGGTRRVSVRPAVLVECPDAETAGRVRGLGGAQVTEITPTLLRLDASVKARAALIKKLREKGIFVSE